MAAIAWLPIPLAILTHALWQADPVLSVLAPSGIPLPVAPPVLDAIRIFVGTLECRLDPVRHRAVDFKNRLLDTLLLPVVAPGLDPQLIAAIQQVVLHATQPIQQSILALHRDVRDCRRDVAELRRDVAEFRRDVAEARRETSGRTAQRAEMTHNHRLHSLTNAPLAHQRWVPVICLVAPSGYRVPEGLPQNWRRHPRSAADVRRMSGVTAAAWLEMHGLPQTGTRVEDQNTLMTFLMGGG